jgi:uncharacterized protein (TIGR00661 family)
VKFNKGRVLIAPLDWGLGHATRCIPLIRAFISLGWEAVIATDGDGETLLKQEFPQLVFIKLAGYDVEYSSAGWMMPLKILMQVPKIKSAIKKESFWLQNVIDQLKIDLVVSDNRYGLHTEKVPCIFLTHQLKIKAPYKWIEKKLQHNNFRYISRFTECWIPDDEKYPLAEELSHPKELHPFPLKYIGPLSRFERQHENIIYKYCFLISGPEPQRSLLEKKVVEEVISIKENVIIVRGKPGSNEGFDLPQNITIANHLEGETLQKALNASEYIICRSGYTSIMEIAALQKRSILIPTPGQTEQEYLAEHLMKRGWAFSVPQERFDLLQSLQQAEQFAYRLFPQHTSHLQTIIDNFAEKHLPHIPSSKLHVV